MAGLRRDVERNMAAYHAVRSYKMQQADECWRLRCEVGNLKATVGKLESALRMACEHVADASGTCPYDMFGFRAKDCDEECDDGYAECWRRYFEMEGK